MNQLSPNGSKGVYCVRQTEVCVHFIYLFSRQMEHCCIQTEHAFLFLPGIDWDKIVNSADHADCSSSSSSCLNGGQCVPAEALLAQDGGGVAETACLCPPGETV